MKLITKTVLELTKEELKTIKNFINILDNDDGLSTADEVWDILKSILDDDDEVLRDYGYCLDIK